MQESRELELFKKMLACMKLSFGDFCRKCGIVCDRNTTCIRCPDNDMNVPVDERYLNCLLKHVVELKRLDCYVGIKNPFYGMSREEACIVCDMNDA